MALKAEKFWGVQARIADALGESGGDICRAALIEGVRQPDARVRQGLRQGTGNLSSRRHGHDRAQGEVEGRRSERSKSRPAISGLTPALNQSMSSP